MIPTSDASSSTPPSFSTIESEVKSILTSLKKPESEIILTAPMQIYPPRTALIKFLFGKSVTLPESAFNVFEVRPTEFGMVDDRKRNIPLGVRKVIEDNVFLLE